MIHVSVETIINPAKTINFHLSFLKLRDLRRYVEVKMIEVKALEKIIMIRNEDTITNVISCLKR